MGKHLTLEQIDECVKEAEKDPRTRALGEIEGLWQCSGCGVVANPYDEPSAYWRWAGDHWQHHDGYSVGHSRAVAVIEVKR